MPDFNVRARQGRTDFTVEAIAGALGVPAEVVAGDYAGGAARGDIIIGIAGRKRAGKDTLARGLSSRLGLPIDSFAAPMRAFIADVIGMSADELEANKEAPIDWLDGATPRAMMQTVGTEWGRQMVHRDLWLRSLFARRPDGVIVADVRFPNEAEAIRERGGYVIRVLGNRMSTLDPHVSETPLPEHLVDCEVVNDGTPADLAERAIEALRAIGALS